jgi:hypothetical protein
MKKSVSISVLFLGLIVAIAATPAFADSTLLNTFVEPGNLTSGAGWALEQSQSLAVPFTVSNAVTVDSITVAIDVTGDVTLGIMTDASGLPSNSWLYSLDLGDPTANVSVGGLNWSLGAGNYWLAAVAVGDASGGWGNGDARVPSWAYTSGDTTTWYSDNGDLLPAALITASDTTNVIPEPSSFLLLGSGLAGLAGLIKRKLVA